jgi:hypothetical protein
MANTNAPSGLAPVQYLNGSPWNGQARRYYIAQADPNAYAIGDPVKTLSGGGDARGVSGVVLATAGAGNAIRGVIVGAGGLQYGGPSANINNLNTTVIPATKLTAYYVDVADDPNILFEVQEDSVTSNIAAEDVGENIDLIAGTNSGYLSGWMLDSNTAATGATLQCKIMGLVQRADNAIGAYAKWLVKINNHELAAGTAGV